MSQSTITIYLDEVLKRDFERLCNDVGLDIITVLKMFMKQSVRQHEILLSMKGDKHRITEEELLERIELANNGYCVEKSLEELDNIDE